MLLLTDDIIYDWLYFLHDSCAASYYELIANQSQYIPGADLNGIHSTRLSNILNHVDNFDCRKIMAIDTRKEGTDEYIKKTISNLRNVEILLYKDEDDLIHQIENRKIEAIMTLNNNLVADIILKSDLQKIVIVLYNNRLYPSNKFNENQKEITKNLIYKKIRLTPMDRELTDAEVDTILEEEDVRGLIQ